MFITAYGKQGALVVITPQSVFPEMSGRLKKKNWREIYGGVSVLELCFMATIPYPDNDIYML